MSLFLTRATTWGPYIGMAALLVWALWLRGDNKDLTGELKLANASLKTATEANERNEIVMLEMAKTRAADDKIVEDLHVELRRANQNYNRVMGALKNVKNVDPVVSDWAVGVVPGGVQQQLNSRNPL